MKVTISLARSVPPDAFPNFGNSTTVHQPLKMEDVPHLHHHPLTKESTLQTDLDAFILWTDPSCSFRQPQPSRRLLPGNGESTKQAYLCPCSGECPISHCLKNPLMISQSLSPSSCPFHVLPIPAAISPSHVPRENYLWFLEHSRQHIPLDMHSDRFLTELSFSLFCLLSPTCPLKSSTIFTANVVCQL